MNDNRNRPVIILLVAILLLLASNFIPSGEIISGVPVKKVDLLMDIKEEIEQAPVEETIDEQMWDEDDDFFEDDLLEEEDSLNQEDSGSK